MLLSEFVEKLQGILSTENDNELVLIVEGSGETLVLLSVSEVILDHADETTNAVLVSGED